MTGCSERQRLRLRVPDTPRIRCGPRLAFLAHTGSDRLGRSTLARPNHHIRHQSHGHRAKSVTRDRPTSLSLHLKIRCHKDQTERWIAAREAELLACPYFHVTVTVPAELREVLRANQRDGYAALMKATASVGLKPYETWPAGET